MTEVSKPTPSDLFRDTNYTELFMMFSSPSMLFKSVTTDPANNNIVSRR